MPTLRKGSTGILFENAASGTSPVFEVSDSVESLTLYGVGNADANALLCEVETAATDSFAGAWYPLGSVSVAANGTQVALLQGRVLFVRARITSGTGTMSALLVAR